MAVKSKRRRVCTGWLDTGKPEDRSRKWSYLVPGRGTRPLPSPFYPTEKFKAAAKRVGEEPVERLRWMLDRLQQPVDELRKDLELGLRGNLWYELSLFAGQNPPLDSSDAILSPIGRVIRGLQSLAHSGVWRLDADGPMSRVVSREYSAASWRLRFESSYESPDFATALALRAQDLLMQSQVSGHLAACARTDCGRLFVKRKRGKFCGRQCKQLFHVRQSLAKLSPKERSERRHRYYVRRLWKNQKHPVKAFQVLMKTVPRRPRRAKRAKERK